MLLHDRQMQGVSGGEPRIAKDDFLGALRGRTFDGINHIGYSEKRVEGRLNGVPAIYGNVAVQNFLKHFRVRDQALTIADKTLQKSLRIRLVWMGRTDQVHRNVGIDQNHSGGPLP